jgi:hypothetical protein
LHASEDALDARIEFAQIEGFGDVIIRAHLQAEHFINHVVLRRQHQDRNIGSLLPQFSTDGEAIHFRQHQIENDRVRVIL